MNIAVIGTGYVGLVAGACFAESGNDVICVDKDVDKIEQLSQGNSTIYEPGLPELISRNLREGRLSFTTDLEMAVRKSFIVFIAVGTPQVHGEADLTAVHSVATAIGQAVNEFKVIVIKSTVPVGTNEQVADIIRAATDKPFDMISNPEFLKEGAAVDDFMKPDRVIVGAEDERAAAIVKELYAPFVRTGSPVLVTDVRTAEMTKYASNAYLATKISFMNEFANLCEEVGADVDMVRMGMGLDERIGSSFLFAGVGYGGSCFPKDIDALIATGRLYDHPLQILEAVNRVNKAQRERFLAKVLNHFGDRIAGKRIAVWGLAFKPRTDDMREAPSINIIEGLLSAGAVVSAYDPEAMDEASRIFGSRITMTANNYDCLKDADALLVVTEWQAFRNPNFERMRSDMRSPVIFDGRNIYSPTQMRELGFTYHGVGRKK
jgi:UDPglucose 6-dehydrogenase